MPGTAGEVLARAHPAGSDWLARLSLARFVEEVVRRHGLWWAVALGAAPESIGEQNFAYMVRCWESSVEDESPFRYESPMKLHDALGVARPTDSPRLAELRPHMLTAARLQSMDFPPPTAYIDGLILEGLTILGGKPKLGKSWWAMRAAVTVATGGVAFENPSRTVHKARSLYLALGGRPGPCTGPSQPSPGAWRALARHTDGCDEVATLQR